MKVANRPIEATKKGKPLVCNTNVDPPAIRIIAATTDEAALFEAVEEAGDIGIAGDHAVRDFAAEQAFWRSPQNAQDVVLVR
jgi:hypothetical protein